MIFALPVTVIAYLVMFSFLKVLRMELAEMNGRRVSLRPTGGDGSAPGKTWRQRLASVRSYRGHSTVEEFIDDVAATAMADVHREFEQLGYESQLVKGTDAATSMPTWALLVDIEGQRRFQYLVAPVECSIPTFGGR